MSTVYFSFLLGLPLLSGVLCAFLKRRTLLEAITLVSTGLTFVGAMLLSALVLRGTTLITPKGWFFLDALSAYIMVIVTGSAFVVALYSIGYLRR